MPDYEDYYGYGENDVIDGMDSEYQASEDAEYAIDSEIAMEEFNKQFGNFFLKMDKRTLRSIRKYLWYRLEAERFLQYYLSSDGCGLDMKTIPYISEIMRRLEGFCHTHISDSILNEMRDMENDPKRKEQVIPGEGRKFRKDFQPKWRSVSPENLGIQDTYTVGEELEHLLDCKDIFCLDEKSPINKGINGICEICIIVLKKINKIILERQKNEDWTIAEKRYLVDEAVYETYDVLCKVVEFVLINDAYQLKETISISRDIK